MNVLVTGSYGQLGSEIRKIASENSHSHFDFHDIDTLNLLDEKALYEYFDANKPAFVVNCAAYTAVDKAESDKDNAYNVNVTVVKNLVVQCKKHNSKFIHVSTDYVFNGKNYKPYLENDLTDPQGEYGKTKLLGEKEALLYDQSIIIRTSWLYSSFGNNFVKTIMKLAKERSELKIIFDQIGNPTYASDLASAIIQIINLSVINSDFFVPGIFHYANEGVCSWYDFAKEILNLSHINCPVWPIESKDYPAPAKRPHYSVLNKNKIKSVYHISIPYWKDSLIKCIKIISEK